MDLESLRPSDDGPSARDLARAVEIVHRPEVAWAIDIIQTAIKSGALDTPTRKSSD